MVSRLFGSSLVVAMTFATLLASGCGTLLQKPDWSRNLSNQSKSETPAKKSRPSKIKNWVSDFDEVVEQPERSNPRVANSNAGINVDSIGLAPDQTYLNETLDGVLEDRQFPEFMEEELVNHDLAVRQAVATVNELMNDPNVVAQEENSKFESSEGITENIPTETEISTIEDNALPNSGQPDTVHFSAGQNYPESSASYGQSVEALDSNQSAAIDQVISIKARPSNTQNEAVIESRSMKLFDQPVQSPSLRSSPPSNSPGPSNSSTFIQKTLDNDVVFFQPIPNEALSYESNSIALASWDSDIETDVIRNEHLLTSLKKNAIETDFDDPDLTDMDWKTLLSKTIEAMDHQKNSLPEKESERIRSAIQARLLRLSSGDVEGALQPIKGLSPNEQAFWHHQIVAVGTFLSSSNQRIGETTLHPAAAEDALSSIRMAQQELAELAPLRINTAKLCVEVNGFGQYELAQNTFEPGGQAIVYCELQNFSARRNSSNTTNEQPSMFTARLRGGFQLVDQNNQVVAQQEYKTIEDESRNVRTDFYMYFPISIPELDDGIYYLNISVADENANKRADLMKPIEITVQSQKKAKTARTGESTRR